jgi:hypothetical protein
MKEFEQAQKSKQKEVALGIDMLLAAARCYRCSLSLLLLLLLNVRCVVPHPSDQWRPDSKL